MTEDRVKSPKERDLEQKRRRDKASRKQAFQARKSWSVEEDRKILADERPSDMDLSKDIGRSIRAIQHRRNRLKNNEAVPSRLWKLSMTPPTSVPEPSPPLTPMGARIRALAMGFSPPDGATVEEMLAMMARYKPYHDAGVRRDLQVVTADFGPCEVIRILPGPLKAIVRLSSQKERLVDLELLRLALVEQRRMNRRGRG
jgi:hypothetical protein